MTSPRHSGCRGRWPWNGAAGPIDDAAPNTVRAAVTVPNRAASVTRLLAVEVLEAAVGTGRPDSGAVRDRAASAGRPVGDEVRG
ncbi:MAG: hypothetical protein GEV28_03585 [Actinophytocola sp.]|uniref:hypothetical protein n=1 Tax=Actinophytocola sp. TaxID=1872138 RepID=UPI001327C9C8|nr:hypothetical protein [Actinophytocola sp.]MPZ79516.1 hypothetical protein [Actinophytocola sp.]